MPLTEKLWDGTRILGDVDAQQLGIEFEVHHCGVCGVIFALDKNFAKARRDDHASWQCPNGHTFHWGQPSEKEKLKRQLEQERDRAGRLASRLDQTKAELQGTKAAKTRFKNERDQLRRHGAAGVCPHPECHRHFTNLERHVKSKHPELLDQVRAEASS